MTLSILPDSTAKRDFLGKNLHPLVAKHMPDQADKITGMLLDTPPDYVLHLIATPSKLKQSVAKAMKVLEENVNCDQIQAVKENESHMKKTRVDGTGLDAMEKVISSPAKRVKVDLTISKEQSSAISSTATVRNVTMGETSSTAACAETSKSTKGALLFNELPLSVEDEWVDMELDSDMERDSPLPLEIEKKVTKKGLVATISSGDRKAKGCHHQEAPPCPPIARMIHPLPPKPVVQNRTWTRRR
jgi:hypothetical protein